MAISDWWARGIPLLKGKAEVDTDDIADDAVTTAKIPDANVTQAKVTPNSLDGTVAGSVANVNVIGGSPLLFRITAVGLTGDVDVVMTHKVRVLDVWCVAVGGAGGVADTITVKNGATAITDAIDMNVADNTIVRAATIDDGQHEINAGADLTVSGASAVTCEVYVLAVRVA